MVGDMIDLLSEQQIEAWASGAIENLRFNPESGMLRYRLTSQPDSQINFKVPQDRVDSWRRSGSHLNTGSIAELKASA